MFEAKDRRLSRPGALQELDACMAERNADYAVLVVPTEAEVPAKMHPLREYNGDKLIVAYDPDDGPLALQVAYSLARARVLMARGEAGGVDAAAVTDTVERAVAALDDVRRIRQQLTGAKTQIDKASEIVGAMSDRVRAHLEEIAALAREAAGDGDAPAGGPAGSLAVTPEPVPPADVPPPVHEPAAAPRRPRPPGRRNTRHCCERRARRAARHGPRPRAGRVLPRVHAPPRRGRGRDGWVANRPDGTVEAHFEGSSEDVGALVAYARRGPRGADVTRVEVRDADPEGLPRFDVR